MLNPINNIMIRNCILGAIWAFGILGLFMTATLVYYETSLPSWDKFVVLFCVANLIGDLTILLFFGVQAFRNHKVSAAKRVYDFSTDEDQ